MLTLYLKNSPGGIFEKMFRKGVGVMDLMLAFAGGIVLGLVIALVIVRMKAVGTLRVDSSDPDGPFMFLELSTDVATVCNKKHVTLLVNTQGYLSQK